MPVVALAGVKIAELALAQGEPALAGRLLGASDSVRGTPDRSDPDAAALTRKVAVIFGPATDIQLETGRRLPSNDAIALLEEQLTRPADSRLS